MTTLVCVVFLLVAGIFFWGSISRSPGNAGVDRTRGLIVALRWYVVHAYSTEHACRVPHRADPPRGIGAEIRRNPGFRPKKLVEMRDGVKRKSERKFYPGYVLVQWRWMRDTWHLVRRCAKVLGFIGGNAGEKPAPLRNKEAMQILRPCRGRRGQAAAQGLFEPGEVSASSMDRSTFQRRRRER